VLIVRALSEQIIEGGLEGEGAGMARAKPNHFGYFNSWPEVTRLAVMMCVVYPLSSLPNVEDLLHERGIKICHETAKSWWNCFGVVTSCQQKALLRYFLAVREPPA
jgi:hypothetical protein